MVRMSTQLESDIVAVERVEEYLAVRTPSFFHLDLHLFLFVIVIFAIHSPSPATL
jgi:hypothetical protein